MLRGWMFGKGSRYIRNGTGIQCRSWALLYHYRSLLDKPRIKNTRPWESDQHIRQDLIQNIHYTGMAIQLFTDVHLYTNNWKCHKQYILVWKCHPLKIKIKDCRWHKWDWALYLFHILRMLTFVALKYKHCLRKVFFVLFGYLQRVPLHDLWFYGLQLCINPLHNLRPHLPRDGKEPNSIPHKKHQQ